MKGLKRLGLLLLFVLLLLAVGVGIYVLKNRDVDSLGQAINELTDGKASEAWNSVTEFGLSVKDKVEGVDYEIDDASHFSDKAEVLSGDIPRTCIGENVTAMVLEIGGCKCSVKASEDEKAYLEATAIGKLQGYTEDGVLHLVVTTASQKWSEADAAEVNLYVPAEVFYEKVELNLGAGSMIVSGLSAGEMDLEVGAGKLEVVAPTADLLKITVGMGQAAVKEMRVATLDGEADMGSLTVEGFCQGNIRAKCAMGSLNMTLEGKEEDFNYELTGSLGSLTVNGQNRKGVSDEKRIDNGAEKTMVVECSMGTANISFQ